MTGILSPLRRAALLTGMVLSGVFGLPGADLLVAAYRPDNPFHDIPAIISSTFRT